METHFGILVWEIPWTEEPGGPWDGKESDTTERPAVSLSRPKPTPADSQGCIPPTA